MNDIRALINRIDENQRKEELIQYLENVTLPRDGTELQAIINRASQGSSFTFNDSAAMQYAASIMAEKLGLPVIFYYNDQLLSSVSSATAARDNRDRPYSFTGGADRGNFQMPSERRSILTQAERGFLPPQLAEYLADRHEGRGNYWENAALIAQGREPVASVTDDDGNPTARFEDENGREGRWIYSTNNNRLKIRWSNGESRDYKDITLNREITGATSTQIIRGTRITTGAVVDFPPDISRNTDLVRLVTQHGIVTGDDPNALRSTDRQDNNAEVTPTSTNIPPSSTDQWSYVGRSLYRARTQEKATVEHLQRILTELGLDVGNNGVDGIYGPRTVQAVKILQKALQVAEDGDVGPNTTEALQNILSAKRRLKDNIATLLEAQYTEQQIAQMREDISAMMVFLDSIKGQSGGSLPQAYQEMQTQLAEIAAMSDEAVATKSAGETQVTAEPTGANANAASAADLARRATTQELTQETRELAEEGQRLVDEIKELLRKQGVMEDITFNSYISHVLLEAELQPLTPEEERQLTEKTARLKEILTRLNEISENPNVAGNFRNFIPEGEDIVGRVPIRYGGRNNVSPPASARPQDVTSQSGENPQGGGTPEMYQWTAEPLRMTAIPAEQGLASANQAITEFNGHAEAGDANPNDKSHWEQALAILNTDDRLDPNKIPQALKDAVQAKIAGSTSAEPEQTVDKLETARTYIRQLPSNGEFRPYSRWEVMTEFRQWLSANSPLTTEEATTIVNDIENRTGKDLQQWKQAIYDDPQNIASHISGRSPEVQGISDLVWVLTRLYTLLGRPIPRASAL